MTKAAALVDEMAKPRRKTNAALHVEISRPIAKVIPFPGNPSPRYVRDLVDLMLKVSWGHGEMLLSREKQAIWEDLVSAGADLDAVKRALRSVEAAVRIELWHRVLGDNHG